jgi:DNA polymerase III subunit beta
MRFKINRDAFLKGLTTANKAIGLKSPIPVLMHIKMVLDDSGLELIGSNNELAIKTTIPYIIGEKEIITDYKHGNALVTSKIVTEIVRKVEGNTIIFELIDDTIIEIGDGRSSFKLNTVRVEEYPELDLEADGVTLELNSKNFIKMVEQTAFAASIKEQRPILMAVNLEANDTKLIATATDSARLARKETQLETPVKFNANVPARVLTEIAHLLEKETDIFIAVSDKKILFSFDQTVVTSRLIGGEYPNTHNIIPKTFNYFLEANTKEIVSAIERVSLLSIERENVVKITMNEDAVEVSSKSAQVGSANEQLSTFAYKGERFEVSFNSEYVLAAIKAAQSEDITIAFLGEMKPFVVRNDKDASQVQLVTPVRTY